MVFNIYLDDFKKVLSSINLLLVKTDTCGGPYEIVSEKYFYNGFYDFAQNGEQKTQFFTNFLVG
jgi:hypothetical protein